MFRDKILKWNGWGYNDSYFKVNSDGHVTFTGDKYDISGKVMPHLRPWFEANLGVDLGYETKSQIIDAFVIPPPVENDEIYDMLKERGISFSNAPRIRLMRAHGHTVCKSFFDIK
ncbi:hypothetical protein WR25_13055 isoform B [Diploscapter pachys]|uniref:Alkylglycerone-phosphate synthase n=1 Tax=Diploscapter pachys TaxID=2018661 RepID=A0A2A2L2G0_9BILA|nr:hypothetical protein WR25_13055 isoform B [Diploscapter pachys]